VQKRFNSCTRLEVLNCEWDAYLEQKDINWNLSEWVKYPAIPEANKT